MHRLAKRAKESSVEEAKRGGRHLRGTLAESLDDADPGFSKPDGQLLKFHGAYQQRDRDARRTGAQANGRPSASFMVRVKVPGGMLTPAQYLAMDDLAADVVHGHSLRITTRQNLQLHGVLKGDLKSTIRRVDDALLTTLAGCGDVERNVVAPPAPLADAPHRTLRELARKISDAMAPATNAYREIWLDGELVDTSAEREPLYGEQYLPRKFKTGLALPDDDSVEVRDQDLGLVGIVEGGRIERFNVLVGGGGGMTHRRADTYARLATPLGSIAADATVDLVRTVASMFRDYGDRTDRQHARLKYVVEELGIDAFAEELRRRAPFTLSPWVEMERLTQPSLLGLQAQGDGLYFYGLLVENGRVVDRDDCRLKTAIATVVRRLAPRVVLTPSQDVIFGDLELDAIGELEEILVAHGVALPDQLSAVRRQAMACPALPTCGLALAEAERGSDRLLASLEVEMKALGFEDVPLRVRMTGCPNGCTRPYNADIGIVGRKPGHYDVYLGGDSERLTEFYAELVPFDEIVSTLRPLLRAWATYRLPDEPFADFYDRMRGADRRTDILTGAKHVVAEREATPTDAGELQPARSCDPTGCACC